MSKKNKNNKPVRVEESVESATVTETVMAVAEPIEASSPVTAPEAPISAENTPTAASVNPPAIDLSAAIAAAEAATTTPLPEGTSHSKVIAQLEAMWRYINLQHFGGKLKQLPCITVASRGAKRTSLAWYRTGLWNEGETKRSEINFSAETFNRSRQEIYHLMVRQCVHQFNDEAGTRDVNKVGYHNTKFRDVGTAAHLTVTRLGNHGYADTTLNAIGIKLCDEFTGELFTETSRAIVKGSYTKMYMVPATKEAKDWVHAEAAQQKISMKAMLDQLIKTYQVNQTAVSVVAAPTEAATPVEVQPDAEPVTV